MHASDTQFSQLNEPLMKTALEKFSKECIFTGENFFQISAVSIIISIISEGTQFSERCLSIKQSEIGKVQKK